MTIPADAQIGFGVESTYGTAVTPTRFLEFVDESLNFNKSVKQGQGLRVGARVGRSARRVVTTVEAAGDVQLEAFSKGLGLLFQAMLGSGTSTLVSGTTYQQTFTLGDSLPALTIQKGIPRIDGSAVDAINFPGSVVSQWELEIPNDDIAKLKVTFDCRDAVAAGSLATATYPTGGNLYQFAGAALYSGALTAPTATTLASAATPLASVRSLSVSCNNKIAGDRFNFGKNGRKDKPVVGIRDIAGQMSVEYADTAFRDAVLADTPMTLVATLEGGNLSAGKETLQVVLPEIKIDNELPKANGEKPVLQGINFTVLDNLGAVAPVSIILRTSDSAL